MEMDERYHVLRNIYEKYIESKEIRPFTTEELSFDKIAIQIEERLRKSQTTIQAELNKKIVDKFDQLRDHYRVS